MHLQYESKFYFMTPSSGIYLETDWIEEKSCAMP